MYTSELTSNIIVICNKIINFCNLIRSFMVFMQYNKYNTTQFQCENVVSLLTWSIACCPTEFNMQFSRERDTQFRVRVKYEFRYRNIVNGRWLREQLYLAGSYFNSCATYLAQTSICHVRSRGSPKCVLAYDNCLQYEFLVEIVVFPSCSLRR